MKIEIKISLLTTNEGKLLVVKFNVLPTVVFSSVIGPKGELCPVKLSQLP